MVRVKIALPNGTVEEVQVNEASRLTTDEGIVYAIDDEGMRWAAFPVERLISAIVTGQTRR